MELRHVSQNVHLIRAIEAVILASAPARASEAHMIAKRIYAAAMMRHHLSPVIHEAKLPHAVADAVGMLLAA